MPLIIDKLLTLLAMPVGATILGALAAAVALWRGWRRSARVLAAAAFAWLWFWATPIAADLVVPQLVERYPVRHIDDLPNADAIVVLSGNVRPGSARRPYPLFGATGDRLLHGARMFNAGLAPVVVVSGGVVWPREGRRTMASAMRDMLVALGVPSDAVLVEGRSRTTRQNAVYTAELAAEHGFERVHLVADGVHMQRATATFRKVGLEPVPVVLASGTRVGAHRALRFLPSASQLSASSAAIRERLGLFIYRLRGWA